MSLKDDSGRGVCFCSAVFTLCTCFPFNCSDDTRFTGICFGAWGVIEQSNECFYTQTQSLISKPYMFLVILRHFVLQGHVGRNNLSSYTNKVNRRVRPKQQINIGVWLKKKSILYHHSQLSFFTYNYISSVILSWLLSLWVSNRTQVFLTPYSKSVPHPVASHTRHLCYQA